ncbi:4Fe-4S dicluster domain-containing protein [Acidianus brierleyi]|uniref:4Fe-4S ferredoxin n=1 Tax=Acidianus brierleyi TaxID=41673 RepID=A0A2U9IHQ7_9CREN|nr:4Fe-4S dicluster domain-containing protein [Acidianus brierleyi]AWR95515.1 4Fe-4S ferredoxin [Acidianus brierleyi]
MERKLGFIFDHNKCIICNACVDACNKAYGMNWRKLPIFDINGNKTALSISCNHCRDPKCMDVCPTGALRKLDNGIVYVEKERCIGCNYCTWACPYEALTMGNDSMTKCHLCMDKLGKGMPYCVEACPTGALAFGWLENSDAKVDYLPPSDITKPDLKIIQPEGVKVKANVIKEKEEKNYLGLLIFTIFSEISLTYSLLRLPYFLPVSIVLLLSSLILSITHAKFFSRALAMIYGIKNSWLSREVIFGLISVLFFILTFIYPQFFYPAVLFLCLSVLSSIMIYMLKSRPSWYNPDTPMSFIGTCFTVVMPLAFFFTSNIAYIIIGIIFGILEIFTAYRKRDLKERKFNIIPIVLLGISTIFLPVSIISSASALVIEIIYRRKFFKKVIYYGIPNI